MLLLPTPRKADSIRNFVVYQQVHVSLHRFSLKIMTET